MICTSCIVFLFALFAASTILLLFKIPVTGANAVVALMATLVFVMVKARRPYESAAITLAIIAGSIALASFYYDGSWDGNVYHKLCVGLIRSGWNPIYESFDHYANASGRFLQHDWDGFYDGYPKASYIIGACLYAITGNIESGKAFTLISMVGMCGIITVFLKELADIRWRESVTVSFFLCVNAISLGALFTFYNDAFLSMLIFGTVIALIYLGINESRRYNRLAYLVIFMSIVLGVNLKFSALFPFAVIVVVFIAALAFGRHRNARDTAQPSVSMKNAIAFFALTALCAMVVFGSTSYLHNWAFYRNPLYPMIGPGKEDIVAVSVPPSLADRPPMEQLLASLFSSLSQDPKLDTIPLKVPFSFDVAEVKNGVYSGARVGGWGIFFSGILLASLAAYALICRRVPAKLNIAFWGILAITFAPALFIPALNNARYWPLPALIPPFVLFLLFATKSIRWRPALLIAAVLAANIAAPLGGLILATKRSWLAHNQFAELAATEHRGDRVVLSLGPPYLASRENLSNPTGGYRKMHGTEAFNGLIFNLDDAGITKFTQVEPGEISSVPGNHVTVALSINKVSPIGLVYVAAR